jgi:tetratricopeptide (TPR) repeat protein
VPVVLLCLARPDLLDRRPGWTAARERVETLVLEPLSEPDAEALLSDLGAELDEPARARVLASAEGNPLYVEQMAALAESGELVVPPTIQALLAERLDRLEGGERAILERAAIVGREFSRRAVTDLCPPELRPDVGRHLLALVRKELIRPHAAAPSREDGFRFRHGLIRDAAYAAMPKETRALFHEWFADWMERNAGERIAELEEIVGYHLEQAVQLRRELGPADARARRLANRATERLGAAGRRALAHGDMPATLNLLERAAALGDATDSPDPRVLLDLGAALREQGDALRADHVLSRAAVEAERAGDEALGSRVRVERSVLRVYLDPAVEARQVLEVAEQVTPIFEARGDQLGLSRAWGLVAEAHWMRSRYAAMEEVLERALVYAERAGDRREVSWILGAMCRVAVVGPRPVAEGVRRCLEIRERSRGEPTLQPVIDSMLAVLEAMRERPDEAREHYRRSRAVLEELGLNVQLASLQMYAGLAELILGDVVAAERELRPGYEALERMGERSYLSTMAGLLARAVDAQGRHDDAEELTRVSEGAASEDDLVSQVLWRGTRAKVLARLGQSDADRLARASVSLARQTDFVNMQADALVDLAETLVVLGRSDEAAEHIQAAIGLYEVKGNVASSRLTAGRAGVLSLTPSA